MKTKQQGTQEGMHTTENAWRILKNGKEESFQHQKEMKRKNSRESLWKKRQAKKIKHDITRVLKKQRKAMKQNKYLKLSLKHTFQK